MRTLHEIHQTIKREAEKAVDVPGVPGLTDRDYEEIFYNALQAYINQALANLINKPDSTPQETAALMQKLRYERAMNPRY